MAADAGERRTTPGCRTVAGIGQTGAVIISRCPSSGIGKAGVYVHRSIRVRRNRYGRVRVSGMTSAAGVVFSLRVAQMAAGCRRGRFHVDMATAAT